MTPAVAKRRRWETIAAICVLPLILIATSCGSTSAGRRGSGGSLQPGKLVTVPHPPFALAPNDTVIAAPASDGMFLVVDLRVDQAGKATLVHAGQFDPSSNGWKLLSFPAVDGQLAGGALVPFGDTVALLSELCPVGIELDVGCPGDGRIVGWSLENGRWRPLPQVSTADSAALRGLATVQWAGGTALVTVIAPRGTTNQPVEIWQLTRGASLWSSTAPPPLANPGLCEETTGRLVAFGETPGQQGPATSSGSQAPDAATITPPMPTKQLSAAVLEPGATKWTATSGSALMTGIDPAQTGVACGENQAAVTTGAVTASLVGSGPVMVTRRSTTAQAPVGPVTAPTSNPPTVLLGPVAQPGEPATPPAVAQISSDGAASLQPLDLSGSSTPILAAVDAKHRLLLVAAAPNGLELSLAQLP